MANTIDYHVKLMLGDLALQLAAARAEVEALRENQKPARKPKPEPDAKP